VVANSDVEGKNSVLSCVSKDMAESLIVTELIGSRVREVIN